MNRNKNDMTQKVVVSSDGKLDYSSSNSNHQLMVTAYLDPRLVCINCSEINVGSEENPFKLRNSLNMNLDLGWS